MSDAEPTTAELVKQCLAGRQAAWEALISRYERLIYHTALQTGIATDEAGDVFQAVCLIWLEQLHRLRDPEQVGAWLVTTTRRECWARFRRSRPVIEDSEASLAEQAAADESPEAMAAQAEDARAVRRALRQLPEPCRTLLLVFFYDSSQPTYAQIAERLHIPAGSLGPMRARCLAKLKEILQRAGWS